MPDLIFYNAKIVSIDANRVVCQVIAIIGDKISAVGENTEILGLANHDTQKIDLEGNLMLPGFIDSHLHILAGGDRNNKS